MISNAMKGLMAKMIKPEFGVSVPQILSCAQIGVKSIPSKLVQLKLLARISGIVAVSFS